VLCLNGRQVAFGPPAEALTMEALEQTYGSDIVRFDGGGLMTVEHHHAHGHEEGHG
jgi:manganese/iron transport system ATP-binding protein/manganese/zinc/iron transport system ATP- binding protein